MIVVTGANGFIGSAFVAELNRNGHKDILCVDPVSIKDRPNNLSKLDYADLITETEFISLLEVDPNKIDFIFHMGACSSTTETNKEYLQKNNTRYSQKLFEFCTANNVNLIYASSGAVYGDGKQGFDDNIDPSLLSPLNLYGWSKSEFDVWALKQKNTPQNWYGLRFFNVYGPNEYHKGPMKSLVCKAFSQINHTGAIQLFRSHNPDYKDGMQLRDFVYIKDITRWMYELYKNKSVTSGVYNMGYGQARTWLDLVTPIFSSLKKDIQIDWIDIPENIRDQYQYFTEAKITKLLSQGLPPPQWDVKQGVTDYIENYLLKDDPYFC